MYRLDHSPSSSPARKRQRLSLSSPTYDRQVGELSQEDLEAFDEIEGKLSQSNNYPSSNAAHERLGNTVNPQLRDDPDNPFATDTSTTAERLSSASKFAGFSLASSVRPSTEPPIRDYTRSPPLHNPFATDTSTTAKSFASASTFSGFASASSIRSNTETRDYTRSPSPEAAPPEPDYGAWFAPATNVPSVAFQSAKFTAATSVSTQDGPIAFTKASGKGLLQPSSVALAKAKEKMDVIWAETPSTRAPVVTDSQTDAENLFKTAASLPHLASPDRPALRALDNLNNSPGTPSPAEFSRASSMVPKFSSPAIGPLKGKPFKAPAFVSSPLNPKSRPASSTFVAASTQHRLSHVPVTPVRPSPGFVTPVRPIHGLSVTKSKPGFRTPFKPGMRPGEPGRTQLEKPNSVEVKLVTPGKQLKQGPTLSAQRTNKQFFDLTQPTARKTLLSFGLAPQKYTAAELENFGIAVSALRQITPPLALYYSFHTPSSEILSNASPNPAQLLGPATALEELMARGCSLATKLWVDNHWCLILWKLAGMVCLEPERERDPQTKRWCWAEVIRQLLYRYERELNGGVRPPLRCIATQDAPASCPMVLCVSNITWSEAGTTDDGLPIPRHPELEVTDGWYRLRAQVDAPLARAVRRGVIRIGRKIGVVGARLSSERKDPQEVLEAYNSTRLVLSGNSSHLVPWYAKLGFQIRPWVATMHSLTADGGVVAAMDVVLLKVCPIAFLEFVEDENGEKHREGPWNEHDEAREHEKWKRRREVHGSKLREELAKKEMRYQSYAERLHRKAGSQFAPSTDEEPTDEVEGLYDQLEDPAEAAGVLSRVSANTAGWLARIIVDHMEKERDQAAGATEHELQTLCPPRDVRNFRVLFVQDACTRRHGANRTAQLTVWDALGLSVMEVGQRYAVTNLVPTAQSAWMDYEVGSEIYLSTRRDSQWKRLHV
ncbi:hypothetical protein GGX14DRAFT_505977 [Mycena pura]|uniref:BRCA2 OB1 domain-containing protein n=1 Tax=Mycena pura TaxID=153505 RepID=A0AAD6US22_9AGAR|nr:hypothetical protein GGX14DRAFT_505977 [Mycena pura]